MIHGAAANVWGGPRILRLVADDIEKLSEPNAQFIASRTGQPIDVVRSWLGEDDVRLTVADGVRLGFLHGVEQAPGEAQSGNQVDSQPTTVTESNDDALALEIGIALRKLRIHDRDALRATLGPLFPG